MRKTLTLGTLLVCSIVGQTYIGGRVTDPSGLVLPRVQIVVIKEATNTTIKTESNDTGDYTVSI